MLVPEVNFENINVIFVFDEYSNDIRHLLLTVRWTIKKINKYENELKQFTERILSVITGINFCC